MDQILEAYKGVYHFQIKDGEVCPPKYKLPKKVKERCDYFAEDMEHGLTFLGALTFILAYSEENCKKDYALALTKEWLPLNQEVEEWFRKFRGVGEMLVAVYLIYGLEEDGE